MTTQRRSFCDCLCTLLAIALAWCSSAAFGFELSPNVNLGRRDALASVASLLTTAVASPAAIANADSSVSQSPKNGGAFRAYSIIPDSSASLSPGLVSIEVR